MKLLRKKLLRNKRLRINGQQIHELRGAYQDIFADKGTLKERTAEVEEKYADNACIQEIVEFIRNESSRALCVPREQKEHV